MENTIKELAIKDGTPFYIFNENGFVENYRKLEGLFQAVYPDYKISYSYKTNYTPYICNLIKDLGGYAEVVSDMEYTLAKKLGYPNDRIVYNGPSKGFKMYEHLDNDGIINIDSYDETKNIVKYCKNNPHRKYKCGLRINLYLSDSFVSRFGMQEDSEDLFNTIESINNTPNLKIVGLHCHISRCRTKEAWAKRAETMIRLADKYLTDIPEYISLGSGMYAEMPEFLKEQFGGDSVPTYQDYAEAAIRPFAERYGKCDRKPILFTEPGTTLVARYINFVSRILSIKNVRGRNIANMDGSFHNLGEICGLKKLPINVISEGKEQKVYENIDIMGYTCLEQDLMYGAFDRPVACDDILVFENVGGYSIVDKPQFIKPQCKMYVKKKDGSIKSIMREETFEDVFDKFSFDF